MNIVTFGLTALSLDSNLFLRWWWWWVGYPGEFRISQPSWIGSQYFKIGILRLSSNWFHLFTTCPLFALLMNSIFDLWRTQRWKQGGKLVEAGIHLQTVNVHLHPDQGCSPRERPGLPRRNWQNLRGTTVQRNKAVDFTDYAHKNLKLGSRRKSFWTDSKVGDFYGE